MQQRNQVCLTGSLQQVVEHLRRCPISRSIAYLGGAALLLQVVAEIQDRSHPYVLIRQQLATAPLGAAFTYACVCLRPEDRARWNRVPLRQGLVQLLEGAGLGVGAFLVWMGIAARRGWVSVPAWGWKRAAISDVVRSVGLLVVGHLAVAWNEEMVFRGYGFDTVRTAIGQPGAVGVMIPFFAVYHGLDPQSLLGTATGGTVLMLLRLQSDSLWLPVGYHWAWNTMQTAIFGPPDAVPTLRPLYVHGPELWVGRPGYPEPGLLNTLIQLIVALLVVMWGRRTKR